MEECTCIPPNIIIEPDYNMVTPGRICKNCQDKINDYYAVNGERINPESLTNPLFNEHWNPDL